MYPLLSIKHSIKNKQPPTGGAADHSHAENHGRFQPKILLIWTFKAEISAIYEVKAALNIFKMAVCNVKGLTEK